MSQSSGADDDRSEFRTNLSLIKNVRDPSDGESWRRFHEFYAPLLMRYLRRLGLEEDRANDLVQDVFVRLLQAMPTFELDSSVGRFRSYLWKLTYSALVDQARRVKTRLQAEEQWVKRFHESSEAESRKLQDELNEINQEQDPQTGFTSRPFGNDRARRGRALSSDCSVIEPARTSRSSSGSRRMPFTCTLRGF